MNFNVDYCFVSRKLNHMNLFKIYKRIMKKRIQMAYSQSLWCVLGSGSCIIQMGKWATAPTCLNNAKHLMRGCPKAKSFFSYSSHPIGQLHRGSPKHLVQFPTCHCALACFPQSANSSWLKSQNLHPLYFPLFNAFLVFKYTQILPLFLDTQVSLAPTHVCLSVFLSVNRSHFRVFQSVSVSGRLKWKVVALREKWVLVGFPEISMKYARMQVCKNFESKHYDQNMQKFWV